MVKSALAKQEREIIQLLLVEDNSSDAFVVESLLDSSKTAHYVITCVKTQAAAIHAIAHHHFDVCLLDMTLPDSNGFSAMIDIQEKVPDMPVLILTGINDMALAKRAVGRGAQDYLLKDEMDVAGLVRAIDYAIERKHLEKELFQRANHDMLTGLANREFFTNRLTIEIAQTGRSNVAVTVLFIDLDRFKPINDAYGHDAGDEALRIVAQRIKKTLRVYDMAARVGGDEFAVLLDNINNPRDAANIAQKIVNVLSEPILHQNHSLAIGASVGIAILDNSLLTADSLLQHADTAMYYAKKEGGNTYRFYKESMHEEVKARFSFEEDLCAALDAHELRLYYQPYVNLVDGAVVGVEALLRWAHPERGLLVARDFLPVAESAKLMMRIAQWTCGQLRHDIAMWNAQEVPALNIIINFSATQIDSVDLLEWIAPIAQKDFLGRHRLIAEISEATVMSISNARHATLSALHEMGVGLHLDHFGCCALPLTILTSLPFSMLKMDMSLIHNAAPEASSDLLISTAIMLAHHLKIKAGAVGVEHAWQAEILKAQHCDSMQGYLVAEEIASEQLAQWLNR